MPENGNLPLIFRHAWVLFILLQCINGGIYWLRAKPRIAKDPTLREGYRRITRAWMIYGNVPWVVMGAGILSGSVPSIFHYFNPRNGPFVLAFYASIVTLWIATFHWLFFRDGAEELLKYPGLINLPLKRPWAVKAYFILSLAGGVIGLSVMIFGNIPAP